MSVVNCEWGGETFELLPEKAIWWKERSTILLADLHFGKIGHFRKSGIPLPQNGFTADLSTLDELIKRFRPDRLLVLGDIFHSDYNRELDFFRDWRSRSRGVAMELVPGNHDILDETVYAELSLDVREPIFREREIVFCHDPEDAKASVGDFHLSGHVHPGVKLSGKGPQRLRLPCFYFGQHQAILPAFGHFTGKHCLRPKKGDQVYVVANEEVVKV